MLSKMVTYSFTQLWRPEILLVIFILAAMYFSYINRLSKDQIESVSLKQKSSFIIALFFLYIAVGSPLNLIAHHYLFTAHMVQMAILYLVVPPLLLVGLPIEFFKKILKNAVLNKIWMKLVSPLLALFLFNSLFSLYHLPFIFNTFSENFFLKMVFHSTLFTASFSMWWILFCPIKELDRLSGLQKIGYIVASGVLLYPACSLIIFSDTPLYNAYRESLPLIPSFSYMEDQSLGGVMMKIIQELIYGITLGLVFFKWAKKERGKDVYGMPSENIEMN